MKKKADTAKNAIDVLASAISDVGYWRWWIIGDDAVQLEFGGVQMLNGDTLEKDSKSDVIALSFIENSFLTFYDDDEENGWHIKLQKDEIEPFDVHYDFFLFNSFESIAGIEKEYKNKTVIKEQNNPGKTSWGLVFKADGVAVAAGGDFLRVIGNGGDIGEEKTLKRNELWWAYWEDYWKKKNTEEAYSQDYACEATIPLKTKPTPGNEEYAKNHGFAE